MRSDLHRRFTFPPALKYRDFRLFWAGLLVSIAGSMMQNAAILWHIYVLTGSPLALGIVGLVRVLPIVGFSLISGVIADIYRIFTGRKPIWTRFK